MKKTKILLAVAGFDPSSGAGITLDLKVFHLLGFYGVGILTSFTAQNSKEVTGTYCPPPSFILRQYAALKADFSLSGIKVGMIGSRGNLPVIDKILSENAKVPRVIDCVLKSSSGAPLIEDDAVSEFLTRIKSKASLITPNLEDAEKMAEMRIKTPEDMKAAAKKIHGLTLIPCLVKGGHLKGPAVDVLYDGTDFHPFTKERINKSVHGTGCFLSSSLLACLALGKSLPEACFQAKELTYQALKSARPFGHGQEMFIFSPHPRL